MSFQEQYGANADVIVREFVEEFKAIVPEHNILGCGDHSPEWIDLKKLWADSPTRQIIGELLAYTPHVLKTGVIVGIPHGGELWAEVVSDVTQLPLIKLGKLPFRGRGIFTFLSDEDEALAQQTKQATFFEDVIYHGGSAASARALFPDDCQAELRAIWRRGEFSLENRQLFKNAHFLVEQTLKAYPAKKCPNYRAHQK